MLKSSFLASFALALWTLWTAPAPAATNAISVASSLAPQQPGDNCADQVNSIAVTIRDVRSGAGKIAVELHAPVRRKDFLKKRGRLVREFFPAQAGELTICVQAPEPGTYAIAIFHDENDNDKFDKTWIGIPSEPFGISRNPRIGLSKPSVKETSFEVPTEGIALDITLRH